MITEGREGALRRGVAEGAALRADLDFAAGFGGGERDLRVADFCEEVIAFAAQG